MAYVSYDLQYQSASFHHSKYVGSAMVVTVASLSNDSVSPGFTIFMLHGCCNPIGKESESLRIDLSLMNLL